jgi:predicted nucleic acid-binding protein
VKFLADTNVVSELTKAAPSPAVVRWMETNDAEVGLSWIAAAELRSGVLSLPEGKRRDSLQDDVEQLIADYYDDDGLRLTIATANRYAELVASRKRSGIHCSFADTVTAAVALERGLTVVTRNIKDFPDVPTVNPWNEKAPAASTSQRDR